MRAIGEDRHRVLVTIGIEPLQIGPTIVVAEEHVRATIAALGGMVREAGKHCARQSRHAAKLAEQR